MATSPSLSPSPPHKKRCLLYNNLDAVKCAVCHELRQQVTLCAEGHTACAACARVLSKCMLCQGALLPLPAFIPCKNVLSALTGVVQACRYSFNGCPALFVVKGDAAEVDAHEAACPCRTHAASCAYDGCAETFSTDKADAHRMRCAHRPCACPMCGVDVAQGAMEGHFRAEHGAALSVASSRVLTQMQVRLRAGSPVDVLSPPIVVRFSRDGYLCLWASRGSTDGEMKWNVREWRAGAPLGGGGGPPFLSEVTVVLTNPNPTPTPTARHAFTTRLPLPHTEDTCISARKVLGALRIPGASRAKACDVTVGVDVTWYPSSVLQ